MTQASNKTFKGFAARRRVDRGEDSILRGVLPCNAKSSLRYSKSISEKMRSGTNTNDLLSQFKASSALSRLQLTLVSHNKYNSLLDHRFTVALQSGNDRRF